MKEKGKYLRAWNTISLKKWYCVSDGDSAHTVPLNISVFR